MCLLHDTSSNCHSHIAQSLIFPCTLAGTALNADPGSVCSVFSLTHMGGRDKVLCPDSRGYFCTGNLALPVIPHHLLWPPLWREYHSQRACASLSTAPPAERSQHSWTKLGVLSLCFMGQIQPADGSPNLQGLPTGLEIWH